MPYLKHISNKIISIINIIYLQNKLNQTEKYANTKIIINVFNILTNDAYNLITAKRKNNVRKINNNSVN